MKKTPFEWVKLLSLCPCDKHAMTVQERKNIKIIVELNPTMTWEELTEILNDKD